jgi:5,5'-dehydrodivanillate O-demethylase
MLSREENEMMTRVGPGTPAGEMLRRYWWPIGFAEEITPKSRPNKIKLLGEEFVLFRSGDGKVGLLALHCCHRGASLQYGRVEEQGIRCCYHGWVYDVNGRCLEQPAEPEDSTFKDRVKQPAYKVQELGGLIFAYIGPEPAPLLPRYDLLVRLDGKRVLDASKVYCNWLQAAENTVDQTHIPFLHASGYPELALKKPAVNVEKTWYGARASLVVEGIPKPKISHCIFPAHNRFASGRIFYQQHHTLIFRVPTDDTEIINFGVKFYPNTSSDRSVLITEGWTPKEPGVYGPSEDGYWGVESSETDRMAMESEGTIYDRSREHLGASDAGVILLRQLINESINALSAGKDPVGIIRDPHENECIVFDASSYKVNALAGTGD